MFLEHLHTQTQTCNIHTHIHTHVLRWVYRSSMKKIINLKQCRVTYLHITDTKKVQHTRLRGETPVLLSARWASDNSSVRDTIHRRWEKTSEAELRFPVYLPWTENGCRTGARVPQETMAGHCVQTCFLLYRMEGTTSHSLTLLCVLWLIILVISYLDDGGSKPGSDLWVDKSPCPQNTWAWEVKEAETQGWFFTFIHCSRHCEPSLLTL